MRIRLAWLLVTVSIGCSAQTPVEVEPVKELKPTSSLSTCDYRPTPKEQPYFEKLDAKEQATGSFIEGYDIHKKDGQYVSWYGVVRGISRVPNSDSWDLLLEQK